MLGKIRYWQREVEKMHIYLNKVLRQLRISALARCMLQPETNKQKKDKIFFKTVFTTLGIRQ